MRFNTLPQRTEEQQDKVKAIAESHGLTDEVSSSVSALKMILGTRIIIMILAKEESRLAENSGIGRRAEETFSGRGVYSKAILVEPEERQGRLPNSRRK